MSLLVLDPLVLFFFDVAVLSLLILYSTLQVLQFCFRAIHFRQAGVLYGPGFCVRSVGMESASCQAAHDS